MTTPELSEKSHWIFDLDGTLTVAQHDFAAIRQELNIPENEPILEFLEQLPAVEAQQKKQHLDHLEAQLALEAQAARGADNLLKHLKEIGTTIGIVTRNNTLNAWAGLQAAGLEKYFSPEVIIAREQAIPKPSPAGLNRLINQWQTRSASTVMVGDFRYDLAAGREAHLFTVHVAVDGQFHWPELTDLAVLSLTDLLCVIK